MKFLAIYLLVSYQNHEQIKLVTENYRLSSLLTLDRTPQKWHILWSMLHRITNLSKTNSFFLFGPRGTGKSSLVKEHFRSELEQGQCLLIDLLRVDERINLATNPDSLESRILPNTSWVFIDEVQKVPAVLDTVHRIIEEKKIKFALTGSSARKLKAGGANLLAGRAFVYHLSSFTSFEQGDSFSLIEALSWGMLPKLLELSSEADKRDFLQAYTLTYLQEEIWDEHLVRNLSPFRKFLQVAAQANGKVINYSNVANDVRIDVKSAQQYFQILEDTLIGFFIEPHHRSLRKRQLANAKFYFFDVGVSRALTSTFSSKLAPTTLGFGNFFEHFLIAELRTLNNSLKRGYEFFFYRKDNKVEVDLVIERPNAPIALVEIKSHEQIEPEHVTALEVASGDYPEAELFCLSLDKHERRFGRVQALPWQKGIEVLGLAPTGLVSR